ncbi:MAG: EscU/YscU/HrcU family type III secretion system export apparatus switch protein [Halieaceae bacterium]|nr:EscU/YscU/HrcU family type III secretion system export apparatus switch protein [Halieaceae bacterium]
MSDDLHTGKRTTAVGLEYGQAQAPSVVLNTSADDALAVLEEAKRLGIPISHDPQLVGLLSQLDVGEEIPEELFVSVAVALSWVYWLKGLTPDDGPLRS